jgi:hypothetical protein
MPATGYAGCSPRHATPVVTPAETPVVTPAENVPRPGLRFNRPRRVGSRRRGGEGRLSLPAERLDGVGTPAWLWRQAPVSRAWRTPYVERLCGLFDLDGKTRMFARPRVHDELQLYPILIWMFAWHDWVRAYNRDRFTFRPRVSANTAQEAQELVDVRYRNSDAEGHHDGSAGSVPAAAPGKPPSSRPPPTASCRRNAPPLDLVSALSGRDRRGQHFGLRRLAAPVHSLTSRQEIGDSPGCRTGRGAKRGSRISDAGIPTE